MEFHDQSDYDAPQFVDFQKVNLPEVDDSWFDKKESHEIGQPLSVCRHSTTTEEPKFVETSPKLKSANKRREVLESSETILLRQIHKQREDAEIQLKRAEVRKLRAFMSPSYAPIRSEKELTRPIEPVLATELRSRLRAKKIISTKVNPNTKNTPIVQKEKSDPPSEPPQNINQPKPKAVPLHKTLDKKTVHEGATGISWKREQSMLAQPEPFHLRTDKRVHRKMNYTRAYSCEVKSNTKSVTSQEQSNEEQENGTVSSKDPLGGITRVDSAKNSKHHVPCQPKALLKDTSNSTLEVLELDKENISKKRKQTNLDEEIPSTKRQRSSPTQSTNPEPRALPLI